MSTELQRTITYLDANEAGTGFYAFAQDSAFFPAMLPRRQSSISGWAGECATPVLPVMRRTDSG